LLCSQKQLRNRLYATCLFPNKLCLPETSQDVDEKVEQIVFWMEEFRANQSLQVEIPWEQTAVVKYAAHRRRRFIHQRYHQPRYRSKHQWEKSLHARTTPKLTTIKHTHTHTNSIEAQCFPRPKHKHPQTRLSCVCHDSCTYTERERERERERGSIPWL